MSVGLQLKLNKKNKRLFTLLKRLEDDKDPLKELDIFDKLK